jgi:nitrogen-specific signal transduction histidine kinase
MPYSDPVNWQPITQMPLIASMIDGALDDTREHLTTLNQARARPHGLDDASIDRSKQVHTEQLEFVEIYAQQISRWRTERSSANQTRELNRMDEQNQQLRAVTDEVLTLASELRKGSIDRIRKMSDIELGLQALLNAAPDTPR